MDPNSGSHLRNLPVSEEDDSRPHKRAKIEVACSVCKARKSKCDGHRPVCGPCSTRRGGRDSHACTYRQNEPRVSLTQEHGQTVSTPESARASGVGRHNIPNIASQLGVKELNSTHPSHSPRRFNMPESPAPQDHIDRPNRARQESPVESDTSARGQDVDAMGCLDGGNSQAGLLGASSGASFMRQIKHAAEGGNLHKMSGPTSRYSHLNTKLPRLRRTRHADQEPYDLHLVLPPRRTADHLFKVYWDYSDVIFPWLDQAEITLLYSSLWSTDRFDADERIFHCTLNLMFAIASKLDPNAQSEVGIKSANVYYRRAKYLLMCNLLDISRFEVLQALLLTAQYLQSTNMPKQCFQTIGLAVWIAEDIGLQHPETTNALADPAERELARRVWHGCIVMDKIASMTFGKPSRISKAIINQAVFPLPEGIPDGDAGRFRAPDEPAKLDFFIAFCKLHHVLSDVLESSYTASDSDSTFEKSTAEHWMTTRRLEDLFNIEHSLSYWHENLKSHLRYPSTYVDASETRYVTRQAIILRARYLYTRLLLYRPFFTHARIQRETMQNKASSLELQISDIVITRCQDLCTEAALEIIALIFNNLPSRQGQREQDVLPSWWYIISYVYTASIVLIARSMWPLASNSSSITTLRDGLDQGYQILQHYSSHTSSARRCMSALESIEKKIASPPNALQARSGQVSQHVRGFTNNPGEQADHIGNGDPNDASAYFQGDFENFSWLETALFDWDDDSWTVGSFSVGT